MSQPRGSLSARGLCDDCGRDVSINRGNGLVRAHGYELPQNRGRVGDYCPGGGLPPKRDPHDLGVTWVDVTAAPARTQP